MSREKPILFYDGDCAMCHGIVRFILPRLKGDSIYLAALQSAEAKDLLSEEILAIDSIVFLKDEEPMVKSEAVFALMKYLRQPWRLISLLSILPDALSDKAYDYIAARRSKFFMNSSSCPAIPVEYREYFLS